MTAADSNAVPALLAHRGYAARFPENTLEALAGAVDSGAKFVEFDIQCSKDGVPHLLHDADFNRTAGVDVSVFELSAGEVAAINVGEADKFGEAFSNVIAPTLSAASEWLQAHSDVTAFVEIKAESIRQFGLEPVVQSVIRDLGPAIQQSVIISFDDQAIELARTLTGCPIGWAFREWNDASLARATALAADYLFTNVVRLPPAPEPVWPGPWMWVIYEIVDPDEALSLAARGVGMIETMQFAEMYAALNRTE